MVKLKFKKNTYIRKGGVNNAIFSYLAMTTLLLNIFFSILLDM